MKSKITSLKNTLTTENEPGVLVSEYDFTYFASAQNIKKSNETHIRNNSLNALYKYAALIVMMMGSFLKAEAQGPCMLTVPSFTIDLTGQPAGVWTSPNIARKDQCCGVLAPNECVYFNLTLDSNAAGIQIDMIGADPAGSLFYNIGCTGNYPGGTVKCISGVGPHQITFCKPGGNKNIYKITSISKPLFPNDDTVRLGCKNKLTTLGVVNTSVTWNSIYPGTSGQYNSYLDSTNVASPTYSPGPGAPAYIDYQVCGFPIASTCGFSLMVCDTVRIYNFSQLSASVTPNPATYCNIGPGSGVTLSATASGGSPAYSYTWKNSTSVTVGTGSSYFASASGIYYLEVKDILYDSLECPLTTTNISVSQGTVPTVDAGPSQKKCASDPTATLSGTVQFATSGIWSGGTGTFSPGNTFLNTSYTPSPAELSAGFVKLYLTSSGAGGGCVNKTDSLFIYYSGPLNVSISSASIACFNGTATLNSNITGGTLPYSLLWNNGSMNSSISVGQGNYSIIVYDSLGCSGSANYNLVAPPPLALTFNVSNVTVNGGNDGSASVMVSGGTPSYSVTWSPGGANTFSISNLVYGVYTASVTDANGCNIVSSAVVNEPRCLSFSATGSATNLTCYGSMNGVASVTASGGTPGYTYTWNTNPIQTGSVAVNLNAGVHSVLIADANNCFQTANVTIMEPTMLTNVMTQTNVTTLGGSNGAAQANPFGGTGPYTYLWDFGPTTALVSSLSAGPYSVTVTDNNGCIKTDNVFIAQPPCNGLTLNLYKNNVTCFGNTNGSALAVVSGATGSYTVNWSNGSTGLSVNNLAAGNYSVLVTDQNNCSQFMNFTIVQPSQLTLGMLVTNVSCNGYNNGSIDLTLYGGTYPYNFNWNTNSTSEDLVNLAPGTYSVQVNDANGCIVTGSASLTQPPPFNVTYTTQNVTCIYGTNGAIGLNVSGGLAPFTYTWSTGAFTPSVSGLAAGGYTVQIKDANNCSLTQPLIIPVTQPDSVKADSFIVACPVPGTGQTQVIVIPQGGSPGAYEVSFDNGTTYLAPGVYTTMLANGATYSVVIKDVNNCTSLVPDLLNILDEVQIDSVAFGKCYSPGISVATVSVYPSGGDGGLYSVSFDNGINYLPAGTYTANLNIGSSYIVVVKDTRDCASATQTITLPQTFTVSTAVTSNYNGEHISCYGLSDGSASVTPGGGTSPYTYVWSTVPTQTTASATNMNAGTYNVMVTDANGCSVNDLITLTEPAQLLINIDSLSNYNGYNTRCFGSSDGAVYITANGGVVNYSYLWSNGGTSQNLNGVGSGNYTLTVTDQNNCTAVSFTTLTEPPVLTLASSVTEPLCNGVSNGAIDITAGGGVGPFVYNWSNGSTTEDLSGITAGTYAVVFTDQNNCSFTTAITVTQPLAIQMIKNVNALKCFRDSVGSINLTLNGGTLPYTCQWSNGSTSMNIDNLKTGTYIVQVTDLNGCVLNDTTYLTQPDSLQLALYSPVHYDGHHVSLAGGNDGSINLDVTGGISPYSFLWSNSDTNKDLYNIQSGTYNVSVIDFNGCKTTGTISLTEPLVLEMPSGFSPNSDGKNDYFVVHGIEAYPDNNLTIFNRWGNIVYTRSGYNNEWNGSSQNGNSMPASTYFVVLEINGGEKVLKGFVELRR